MLAQSACWTTTWRYAASGDIYAYHCWRRKTVVLYRVATVPHKVSHIVWKRQMMDLLDVEVVLFRDWRCVVNSESLFTCGVVARLLLLTQQPYEALSLRFHQLPNHTQIHSGTLKAFQILSVTSKVFRIVIKSRLAQHLSYLRSMILRTHDRQVSYPSPCLISTALFLLHSLDDMKMMSVILPFRHYHLYQNPYSWVIHMTYDMIELHVSGHFFALQDLSTTEHPSR